MRGAVCRNLINRCVEACGAASAPIAAQAVWPRAVRIDAVLPTIVDQLCSVGLPQLHLEHAARHGIKAVVVGLRASSFPCAGGSLCIEEALQGTRQVCVKDPSAVGGSGASCAWTRGSPPKGRVNTSIVLTGIDFLRTLVYVGMRRQGAMCDHEGALR